MRFENVHIEAMSHVLPPTRVSSAALEDRLSPLYRRLGLPEGRLELMTGIRERRFWTPGTAPSAVAAEAGKRVLATAGIDPEQVDCVLYCGVSRDAVEPATSAEVHRLLGLPGHAINFDISNACLGVLSGMVVAAGMIERGALSRGLLVTGEVARPLVESTVRELNGNETLTRQSVKPHFASLSIGSGAAAVLLAAKDVAANGRGRLLGGASWSETHHNSLCRGGEANTGGPTGQVLMATDSEELLVRGVDVARRAWDQTREELNWTNETPDLVCTHQVGKAHTAKLFDELGLDIEKNVATFPYLGNCGSASLPMTASVAAAEGRLKAGDVLALLGIGSGINCTMLGVEWTE
mgnify:CR=1 FL=1